MGKILHQMILFIVKFLIYAQRNSDIVQTLQRHDHVNVLTSSRPPFDGADCGTVQDKLLCSWVICGGSLQPSEVSPWRERQHTKAHQKHIHTEHTHTES